MSTTGGERRDGEDGKGITARSELPDHARGFGIGRAGVLPV